MLHIIYCEKDDTEATIEASCEKCEYYAHIVGYFGCDWFECIYLENRLLIGL